VEFIKKQFIYLLLLIFCIAIIALIWFRTQYSEDQKLTGTLFVFIIGIFIGLFNNSLNDKQTIMNSQYKEDIKSSEERVIAALTLVISQVKTDLKTEIAEVKTELSKEIGEVKTNSSKETGEAKLALLDQIAQLRSEVKDIGINVISIDKNLAILKQVLIEKDLIKPF
jgi:hypothetical protein